ncbi:hypothetical protein F5Y07DRAFT_366186 [Xylaria sp. FL0933]|nr:hypothetical protein F5Y07DRAFT_366186 [Xylaria sp. FL0933]
MPVRIGAQLVLLVLQGLLLGHTWVDERETLSIIPSRLSPNIKSPCWHWVQEGGVYLSLIVFIPASRAHLVVQPKVI